MSQLICYPRRKFASLDFKDVEVVTVPNQSMSLKEILVRFTKKQSLPVEHDVQYMDKYGIDFEKLSREDIVEQLAVRDQFKDRAVRIDQVLKQREEAEKVPESNPPPEPTKPPSDAKPDK